MSYRSKVFIGSSCESLAIAERVKEFLRSEFDVFVWNDDIFKSNKSTLQTLLVEAGLFDFGIMILAKDDLTKSRGTLFDTVRDNTLFEFGIFLGRLGESHAFALAETGVKIPSDLYGITIERYSVSPAGHDNIDRSVGKISKQMQEATELGFLGMLPSTVLAIGYFNNFVKDVAESIARKRICSFGGKEMTIAKLNIVIPAGLDSDMKRRAEVYYDSHALQEIQFPAIHRSRPLFVAASECSVELEAYDLPTTLDSVGKAIDMYLHHGHIGKTIEQQLLEDRELTNFRRVLDLKIRDDGFAKKYVTVISE